MATLRKRGDTWHVQVRRSGQSRTRSFTHKTDAEVWARKTERAIDTDELRGTSERLNNITLGDLLKRYRDEVIPQKRSAGSIEHYIIRRYLQHRMAGMTLANFDASAVSRYKHVRLGEVKGSTLVRELGVLRHCLGSAGESFALPECPGSRTSNKFKVEGDMFSSGWSNCVGTRIFPNGSVKRGI